MECHGSATVMVLTFGYVLYMTCGVGSVSGALLIAVATGTVDGVGDAGTSVTDAPVSKIIGSGFAAAFGGGPVAANAANALSSAILWSSLQGSSGGGSAALLPVGFGLVQARLYPRPGIVGLYLELAGGALYGGVLCPEEELLSPSETVCSVPCAG